MDKDAPGVIPPASPPVRQIRVQRVTASSMGVIQPYKLRRDQSVVSAFYSRTTQNYEELILVVEEDAPDGK